MLSRKGIGRPTETVIRKLSGDQRVSAIESGGSLDCGSLAASTRQLLPRSETALSCDCRPATNRSINRRCRVERSCYNIEYCNGGPRIVADQFFISSSGMLGVRTNLKQFKWSFGTVCPEVSREEYQQCVVRLRVELDNSIESPQGEQIGKYHYFNGHSGQDVLYYTRPFMFGSQLRMKVSGLLSPEPVISFNRAYLRFVTHRFMNVHSAGFILTDLAALLLLRQGYAPIHCSVFQHGTATVVVAAPPNTGKTLTTMMACLNHEALFMAEDFAITNGKEIFSVPWTSTFRYYKNVDKSWRSRLGGLLQDVFPPIELMPLRKQQPISEYIPLERMLSKSTATHLVILERGPEALVEASSQEAMRKVRNLNRYEFNYARAPVVIAHEFFNPELDIAHACETENTLLRSLVENVSHRWIVRSPNAMRYVEMIMHKLACTKQYSESQTEAA